MTQINKDYIDIKYPNNNFVKFNKHSDVNHTIEVWINKLMIMGIENTTTKPTIVMFGGDRIVVKETVEEILKLIS